MEKLLSILSLLVCFTISVQAQSGFKTENFMPTGDVDIDSVRKQVKKFPTNINNYKNRLNILDNWARLIAFAGGNLLGYEPYREEIKERFRRVEDPEKNDFKAIDEAFYGLERVYTKFLNSNEGQSFNPRKNFKRAYQKWPFFHGDKDFSRSTKDPGPVKGKLAWKFPTGRPWYSRPAVENGHVYAVSPGMTTVLYSLDEKTGDVIWKSHQRGWHQYGTERMNSSVLLLDDYAVTRELGSGGRKDLVFIDKKSGERVKEEPAGHIDYRVGYAPLDGNDDYIVYPYSNKKIGKEAEKFVATFDSVYCKHPESGELLWTYGVGEFFTEPYLHQDQVFLGTTDGTVYALNAPKDQKRLAWKFRTNGAVNGRVIASEGLVVAASQNGTIYGLDIKSGKKIWDYRISNPEKRSYQQFSAAVITEDRVYIGGADKSLYSLDKRTGELQWQKTLSDWIRSRPVVVGNNVYAATLGGTVYSFKDEGNKATANWIRRPTEHQIFADLVYANGKLYLNSSDLYLHCLDAKTGREQWRHSLMEAVYTQNDRVWADIDAGGGDFQSSATVADDKVLIGGPDRFVQALDPTSGREMWRFEVRGQIPGAPAYANGKVYFGQQGGSNWYYAIDALTGKLVWKQKLGWVWASSLIVDGKVYVASVSGFVYCLDAENGDILWEYDTGNGSYPAPTIEDNVVVFGSWNSKYYGFDKDTGGLLWEKDIKGNPDSGAPLVEDGIAYLQGLASDYFYAVDVQTGKEKWKFPIQEGYACNMSPSIENGKVFFSTFIHGEVCMSLLPGISYAVDAKTGEKIWEINGGGGLTGTAAVNGKVYFASTNDPYVWAVDAEGNANGSTKVYWKFKMGGRAEESSVTISHGKVFVLATDGYLYAIE